ncbi:MAG: PTS sugar transporter subunit IIA, partial [Candidatus Izemoplasmataceae bacterium]
MKKQTVLKKENILLGLPKMNQESAINKAGELLIESGYVEKEYLIGMLEREKIVSTYIGNGVAIPHGVGDAAKYIKHSGIVVLQFPKGIQYHDNKCFLVIGIAGKENEHMMILSNI